MDFQSLWISNLIEKQIVFLSLKSDYFPYTNGLGTNQKLRLETIESYEEYCRRTADMIESLPEPRTQHDVRKIQHLRHLAVHYENEKNRIIQEMARR